MFVFILPTNNSLQKKKQLNLKAWTNNLQFVTAYRLFTN